MRYVRWLIPGMLVMLLLAAVLLWHNQDMKQEPRPGSLSEMGLILQNGEEGLYILAVGEHSLADRAGLQPGDLILQANDVPLASSETLELLLRDEMLQCLTLYVNR